MSLMAPKFRDRAVVALGSRTGVSLGRKRQVTAERDKSQQKGTIYSRKGRQSRKGEVTSRKGHATSRERQITAERDMPPPDRDISWPAVALPTVPAVKNAATIPRKVPIGSAPAIHAIRGRIKAGKAEAGRDKQFPTQLWLKPVLQETHGP